MARLGVKVALDDPADAPTVQDALEAFGAKSVERFTDPTGRVALSGVVSTTRPATERRIQSELTFWSGLFADVGISADVTVRKLKGSGRGAGPLLMAGSAIAVAGIFAATVRGRPMRGLALPPKEHVEIAEELLRNAQAGFSETKRSLGEGRCGRAFTFLQQAERDRWRASAQIASIDEPSTARTRLVKTLLDVNDRAEPLTNPVDGRFVRRCVK